MGLVGVRRNWFTCRGSGFANSCCISISISIWFVWSRSCCEWHKLTSPLTKQVTLTTPTCDFDCCHFDFNCGAHCFDCCVGFQTRWNETYVICNIRDGSSDEIDTNWRWGRSDNDEKESVVVAVVVDVDVVTIDEKASASSDGTMMMVVNRLYEVRSSAEKNVDIGFASGLRSRCYWWQTTLWW